MMDNSRTSVTEKHNENEGVRMSRLMAKKMHWRDSLFYAYLPENGEYESIVFYFHPTCKPNNTIFKSIIAKGGCIADDPSQDLYTVILVNTKSENYQPDTQFKGRYDLFDSAFIESCVEKKKLVDLNLYRIGESNFEEYDANNILQRALKWSKIKKKQLTSGARIASSNSNKNLTSGSKDPTTIKSTNQSKVSKNARNEKEETSHISNAPPTSASQIIINGSDKEHLEISKRKRTHQSSSPPQRLGIEITKTTPGSVEKKKAKILVYTSDSSSFDVDKTEKPPSSKAKSTNSSAVVKTTPGSVEKKKAKILVYTSDSSSSDVDKIEKPPSSKAKSTNSSAVVPQASRENPKQKSLSRKGKVRNTVMNTSNNESETPMSETESHPTNGEKTREPVTRSKSKATHNFPQKSFESSVGNNLSPSKNTRSRTAASMTDKAKIPSCSKNIVEVSKPSSSASALTNTKSGVVDTSKNFKKPLEKYVRAVPAKIPPQNAIASSSQSQSVVSTWLSAIRDSDESTPSPPKTVTDRTKRRYLDVDDARPARSISPIESLNGDDFDNRNRSHNSTISTASTSKRRLPYTQREKQAMLQYVCENNYHNYTRGNKIWEQCENNQIVPGRTWQSLKEHFTKQIFPNIQQNPSVSQLDKKKFAKAIKVVELGRKEEAPIQVTHRKTS